MPVKVGDPVPAAAFKPLSAHGITTIDTATLLKAIEVALFGLPGAYTPVCSVNDPFVMRAWGRQHGADGKVTMLADADGTFTRAIGLSLDLPEYGLSGRSEGHSMVVEDGLVKTVSSEKTLFDHGVSSAATCLLHT